MYVFKFPLLLALIRLLSKVLQRLQPIWGKSREYDSKPGRKGEHRERCLVWKKANLERAKEVQSGARRKYRAKHLQRIA